MKHVVFIDTEIQPNKGTILDIGGIKGDNSTFHSTDIGAFTAFLRGSSFVCGHNIIDHDMEYVGNAVRDAGIAESDVIDTLHLSPLLFPARPYHALVKDDKLQSEEKNNPLNDSKKAMELFVDEVDAFHRLDQDMKNIYFKLLKDQKHFRAFFKYVDYRPESFNIERAIRDKFKGQICHNANLLKLITVQPVELAYSLALIHADSRYSITPPWVLRNYPAVEKVMFLLKSNPCLTGCVHCNEAWDIHKGLKRFFGFDKYRSYDGEPLQQKAVKAAVDNKSLLAIFPTGGGKSLTFQIPALMSGEAVKGLTVIISPLQSLMKDQVDNLEVAGITEAVTINGLLDPIERAISMNRVADGSASILYISPESLRSKTIEHLLLGRNVVRFVIDEAHCFSAWGQDFRVDYLYIGDFINQYQIKKNLQDSIPVSCFTATAKQNVIEDIRNYFKDKLALDITVFRSGATRTNLHYNVLYKNNEEDKYNTLRNLVEGNDCPTIVYVSRTKRAQDLAQRLSRDGYPAKPYHGRMDNKEKSENQDDFISGKIGIMVATSAFGMGVDKKDVGMVIHYDISDSLENYIQEAGRAGRDESISANCYVLFNDDDLNRHFILLNQTKLSMKEIQQVWKAIKDLTRIRSNVSQSALEIARKAGWDDSIMEIETRVKTAIAALEEAGYVRRGQNVPRIYADSILVKTMEEARSKIEASENFEGKEKENALRITRMLLSMKSRERTRDDGAETRVDYIADRLGLTKEEVVHVVNLLREENILADAKDLKVFIKRKENQNRSIAILESYMKSEKFLLEILTEEPKIHNIKELTGRAEENGCIDIMPKHIRTLITLWTIKQWIKSRHHSNSSNHIKIKLLIDREELANKLEKLHDLSRFIVQYLFERRSNKNTAKDQEVELIEFSMLDLKMAYEERLTFFDTKTSFREIENALYYLSRIDALKIEGGFFVLYQAFSIERLEQDTRKRFTIDAYNKLDTFYKGKIQQIHIVGEYAKKMVDDYKEALQFVDDYFQLNYSAFLRKYFVGSRHEEITRNITPSKFKQLFGELSTTQLRIINDREAKTIVVAAGPGSGKTRILVHKLASLVMMEDIKHEQLLMLTFSRAAVTEFKARLRRLIGNAAHYVEIKTFHSYCFDLLGRMGTLEKSNDIIKDAIKKIKDDEVEIGKLTKTVLVIDEAQDMDENEFELIKTLMAYNDDIRVIAVGDDDQNIYAFRGSDSKYLTELMSIPDAVKYELVDNYRSQPNLVNFTNQFVERLTDRMKEVAIKSALRGDGRIRILKYKSDQMVNAFVSDILSQRLIGSIGVLTHTNDEALQITSLLRKEGMTSKLIQSNESFNLFNILEIRYLATQLNSEPKSQIISEEIWREARGSLRSTFQNSSNLDICLNLMKAFEANSFKYKYKSDFEIFVRESNLEDFYEGRSETITVSTIHKAKGREFDQVFLMLNGFKYLTDESTRAIYVAMTRAKNNLTVHYNGDFLESIQAKGIDRQYDYNDYEPLGEIALQLGYWDVWLSYFMYCQKPIGFLKSGDSLQVDEQCCYNNEGEIVVKFSQNMMLRINDLKQKGYYPVHGTVRLIVYWKGEDSDKEIRIVMPEVVFKRRDKQVV
ncbi:MAG TPA: RecQ family ATP-dependent DNA helicase [Clostridiales bacterium]|nr:RecQ family ATP-dependent DNA helicase [Clostridiales bacterium]